MDNEYRQHLHELLRAHRLRHYELEQRAALFGVSTPPEIRIELKSITAELERIETELGTSAPSATDVLASLNQRASAREAASAPINLPPQPPLIGRSQDVAALRELADQDEVRLITLTGSGGVGKTRLMTHMALELRNTFPDGIIFVPLAALTDANLVGPTIVQILGISETVMPPRGGMVTPHRTLMGVWLP